MSTITCKECSGTGQVALCNGYEESQLFMEMVECWSCDGTGIISEPELALTPEPESEPETPLSTPPVTTTPPTPATYIAPSSPDPVLSLLESRARDLSLSIVNPATLAEKLRETLIETVGPDKSNAYHIGATFDGKKVDFQIAYLSPSLLVSLKGNTDRDLALGVSWMRMTDGGWKVEVGVEAAMAGPFTGNYKDHMKGIGEDIKASFSVTISK